MSRIEELEKRLAADPNSRIFVQLAEEYRKAGLLEQAIDVCEEGLKIHPRYPSARVALGRALLEAESYDRASQEFETVLAQIPDNILANKFLGETYYRLGRLDEALQKYRVAQTLAPEDTELEEKIQAVQAELEGGGAKPPEEPEGRAQPAPDATAVPGPAAPPPPAPDAAPPRKAPTPTPPPTTGEELAPGSVPANELSEPTSPEKPKEPKKEEDLAPIPLVDVDEPMVLEERYYVPPATESQPELDEPQTPPEPTPPEEVAREPTVEPPPPSPGSSPSTGPETPTMAEIYASQGHFEQAISVYRRLQASEPGGERYQERIEELQMLSLAAAESGRPRPPSPVSGSGLSDEARRRTIQVLERWLEAIRRERA